MRARHVAWPILLVALTARPAASQSISDRLKKIGVIVKTSNDSTKPAKGDSARGRKVDSLVGRKNSATEAPVALPTSSKAHPDVSGVVLGQSTVRDVKALLAKTPTLLVGKDRMGVLASRPDVRSQPTRIPNTEYVSVMRVGTKVYSTRTDRPVSGDNGVDEVIRNMRADYYCGGGADEKRGNCEDWTLRFAPHPSESVAIAVEREVTTAPSPLGDNVEKSLVEKYGEPSVRLPDGSSRELIWFFKDDGTALPTEPARRCIQPMREAFKYITSSGGFDIGSYAQDLLKNGCVAVVDVSINAPNNVAKRVTYRGLDVFGWMASHEKASQAVADFEKQQRDAAAKVKPPNE